MSYVPEPEQEQASLLKDTDGDDEVVVDDEQDDLPPSSTVKSQKARKLPWNQLFILSICRLADPIALASVFPYLPEMIESFDVPTHKVSAYAGITSATFSLAQACTGVFWGQASDRFGRKPAILSGMICMVSSSLLFGFSKSLTWAILARGLSGASNGNVGIMRTVVAEMVPWKEGQPRAFSIMPVVWQVGSTVAPVIGGLLAEPAKKYPNIFDTGKDGLWRKYPFVLPNLAVAVFFAFGIGAGFLFLDETLETKKNGQDIGRRLGYLLVSFCNGNRRKKSSYSATLEDEQSTSLLKRSRLPSSSTSPSSPQSPYDPADDDGAFKQSSTSQNKKHATKFAWGKIFTRESNKNLLVYTLLAFHSVAYDQLLPVFMHYPSLHQQQKQDRNMRTSSPETAPPVYHNPLKFTGGFGIDSGRIGVLFMIIAGLGMLIQFLVFPPLCSRYGVLANFKFVSILYPICYILTPFTALLPNTTAQMAGILVIMIVKVWCAIFAFPCSMILLTNSASSLTILGTLNGVAVSVSSLGRAAGPFMVGGLLTVGVECEYGILPWWTLAACSILGAIPIWWLVEGDGPTGNDQGSEDDGDDDDDNHDP